MIVLNSAYRIAIKIQLEYVKIHEINVEKSEKIEHHKMISHSSLII